MLKLGLIGKHITHSKSKEVYEGLLGYKINYELFDFDEPSQLPDIEDYFENVVGLSITAPYKKDYADKVNIVGDVSALGIINCIRKCNDAYEATNTDYLAVKDTLKRFPKEKFEYVLLGDGSMAEITIFALNNLKIDFKQFSRSKNKNFKNLDLTKLSRESDKNLLVINSCGRSYTYTGPAEEGIVFWDYNYNHENHNTRLKNSTIQYIDGMELLRDQAIHALKFWGINN